MNITTQAIKTNLGHTYKGRPVARLNIIVKMDGCEMGTVMCLCGGEKEIDAYMADEISLTQLREAWGYERF